MLVRTGVCMDHHDHHADHDHDDHHAAVSVLFQGRMRIEVFA